MTSQTWHRGVGADITADMTIDEQLSVAGLDWHVKTSDVTYGDSVRYESDYRKAIYREDTGLLLDTVGDRWNPFQNRQILETFHEFCGTSGLKIDHLGCLQGGRTIFAGADLDCEIDVAEVGDIVRARLLLFNYHTSGSGLSVKLHLNRLVCTNGLTQQVRIGNKAISHVGSFNADKVTRVLETAHEGFRTFGKQAEILAATSMTIEEAQLILIAEFGDPKKSIDEQPRLVSTCLSLFLGQAQGSEMLSAFNTAWGLLNSVTEAVNYRVPMRGGVQAHINSLWNGAKAARQNSFMQTLVSVCER